MGNLTIKLPYHNSQIVAAKLVLVHSRASPWNTENLQFDGFRRPADDAGTVRDSQWHYDFECCPPHHLQFFFHRGQNRSGYR